MTRPPSQLSETHRAWRQANEMMRTVAESLARLLISDAMPQVKASLRVAYLQEFRRWDAESRRILKICEDLEAEGRVRCENSKP